MNAVNRIKEILFYDGLTKNEYSRIEPAIIEENNKRLKIYNIVALIVIAGVLIISLFWNSISEKRAAYLFGVCSNILMLLILFTVAKKNMFISKIVNYYFITMMLVFTLYIGTITSKGLPASSFFTCLALAPYITYSKNLYGFLHRLITVLIFIAISYSCKPLEIFHIDLLNVLAVFVISTLAGIYFQKLQVNSYIVKRDMDTEIKKMSGIFEKIRVIDLCDRVSADYSIYSNDGRRMTNRCTDAFEQMEAFIDHYVGEYHREKMRQFCDLSTLEDRTFERKVIERDFISAEGIWERAIFVVIEEDSKGFPTKVAFSIKRIADQYYLKALELDIHNMP